MVRSESPLEKHIQTLLLSVITAAALFGAQYMFADNAHKSAQSAELQQLRNVVEELRIDIKKMADVFARREDLADHEARLRSQANEISELKRQMAQKRGI